MDEDVQRGAGRIGKAARRVVIVLLLLVPFAIAVDVVGGYFFRYPPILAFVLHELPFRGERFDLESWSAAQQCTGLSGGDCAEKQAQCRRGRMVRNLVTRHLVPGTATRETVASLIGPAEYDVEIAGQRCDAYMLGMCSGLGWDYDSLYVYYGADGTLFEAGHVQY